MSTLGQDECEAAQPHHFRSTPIQAVGHAEIESPHFLENLQIHETCSRCEAARRDLRASLREKSHLSFPHQKPLLLPFLRQWELQAHREALGGLAAPLPREWHE